MVTKISLLSGVCLLLAINYATQLSQAASLDAMLNLERLEELGRDYKSTMSDLRRRLADSKSSDKFKFAAKDKDFMDNIRKLGSIFKNMGEVEAKIAGEKLDKAAQTGLENGLEIVFDDVQDDEGDLWVIPKIFEKEFKLRR